MKNDGVEAKGRLIAKLVDELRHNRKGTFGTKHPAVADAIERATKTGFPSKRVADFYL